jgi:hypothetical protein
MPRCAAIVFGRTYEVDFRFITIPENFTQEDERWTLGYIQAVMRSAEKLSGQPRWSLFANNRFCIVGLVCMVSDLIDKEDGSSYDVTRDFKNRPLYTFVGYVTDIRQGIPEIPQYSADNIQIFKPLYDHVRTQWLVKSFQPASKTPSRSEYEELTNCLYQTSPILNSDYLPLNFDKQEAVIWPDSKENRIDLWNIASQIICSQNKPISLCLGFSNQRDIVDSQFLNGTTTETTQKTTIRRVTQPTVEVIPEPSQQKKSKKSEEFEEFESDAKFGLFEPICAFVGATLVSRVAGVGGFIIGGGVGWLVAGVLTNNGIGGSLAKEASKFFKVRTSQESNRYSRGQKSQSKKQSKEQSTTSDYGFKQKTDRKSSSRQTEDPEDTWFK